MAMGAVAANRSTAFVSDKFVPVIPCIYKRRVELEMTEVDLPIKPTDHLIKPSSSNNLLPDLQPARFIIAKMKAVYFVLTALATLAVAAPPQPAAEAMAADVEKRQNNGCYPCQNGRRTCWSCTPMGCSYSRPSC